jgi:hypothetical protein
MTDQLLAVLKVALLALVYLFFARVLWAVWSEVRTPVPAEGARIRRGRSTSTSTSTNESTKKVTPRAFQLSWWLSHENLAGNASACSRA